MAKPVYWGGAGVGRGSSSAALVAGAFSDAGEFGAEWWGRGVGP